MLSALPSIPPALTSTLLVLALSVISPLLKEFVMFKYLLVVTLSLPTSPPTLIEEVKEF